MSVNNLVQHTIQAEMLVKNKLQELVDTTIKWKDRFATSCQSIHNAQERHFEEACTATQQHMLQTTASTYAAQQQKHKQDAQEIEQSLTKIQDEMIAEAQAILDQMPVDMGGIKKELEAELRTFGDQVQQDLEYAQQMTHLRTVASAFMSEMQTQVAEYKTEMNSLIGSSREHNALPTMAQYTAKTQLRNEITTEIRNDLGIGSGIHAKMQQEYQKTRDRITQNWSNVKDEISQAVRKTSCHHRILSPGRRKPATARAHRHRRRSAKTHWRLWRSYPNANAIHT
jgi:hypothetical protein